MPNRVGLPAELKRGVVGNGCIGGELGGEEERVDPHVVRRHSRWHRSVEASTNVQDLAGGNMVGEQAVCCSRAPIAADPASRKVLLVREDEVRREEVGRSHGCYPVSIYAVIMRVSMEFSNLTAARLAKLRRYTQQNCVCRLLLASNQSLYRNQLILLKPNHWGCLRPWLNQSRGRALCATGEQGAERRAFWGTRDRCRRGVRPRRRGWRRDRHATSRATTTEGQTRVASARVRVLCERHHRSTSAARY